MVSVNIALFFRVPTSNTIDVVYYFVSRSTSVHNVDIDFSSTACVWLLAELRSDSVTYKEVSHKNNRLTAQCPHINKNSHIPIREDKPTSDDTYYILIGTTQVLIL